MSTSKNQTIEKKSRIVTVCKYSISVKKDDTETLEKIGKLLEKINDKNKGRKLTVSDAFIYMLSKISDEDVKSIISSSLTADDLAEIELENYNTQNSTNLTLSELLLLKLKKNINEQPKSVKRSNPASSNHLNQ
jgi:elongation factor P--beta-lysine ligase